jgi:hypothetical protein
MNYQPAFDIDYRRGLIGEDLVNTFLVDLAGSLIEVKTDYRAHETGNVYVETHQYPQGNPDKAIPSGINISKANWYVFASPHQTGFIAIPKDQLMTLVLNAPRAEIAAKNLNSNQTRGRLVAIKDIIDIIYKGATNG